MKYFILIAAIIGLSSGCHRDNEVQPAPQLPPSTTIGANTMGCYVNGELHTYSGAYNSWSSTGVSFGLAAGLNDHDYYLITGSLSSQKGDIDILLYDTILATGTSFTHLKGIDGATTYLLNFPHVEFKVKSYDPFNWVKFTRIDDSVAAGTFQFKGFTSDFSDSVVVTQGRFDIAR